LIESTTEISSLEGTSPRETASTSAHTVPKYSDCLLRKKKKQMFPSQFTVVYIFMTYLSTTYYHVFQIFPEFHVTCKSFLGNKSAVHFSSSDKQLHVQLTACSPGNV